MGNVTSLTSHAGPREATQKRHGKQHVLLQKNVGELRRAIRTVAVLTDCICVAEADLNPSDNKSNQMRTWVVTTETSSQLYRRLWTVVCDGRLTVLLVYAFAFVKCSVSTDSTSVSTISRRVLHCSSHCQKSSSETVRWLLSNQFTERSHHSTSSECTEALKDFAGLRV